MSIQAISRNLVVLFALYLLVVYNMARPFVRTTIPSLNYFLFAGLILITLGLLILELFRRRGTIRWVGLVLTLPFAVLSIIYVLGSLACGSMVIDDGGIDYSFERITIEPVGDGTNIVGYRTNGGATTDFGMVIRHEWEPVPGLLIVRDLFDKYHANGVDVVFEDSSYVDLSLGWDSDNSQPYNARIKLYRFVYF